MHDTDIQCRRPVYNIVSLSKKESIIVVFNSTKEKQNKLTVSVKTVQSNNHDNRLEMLNDSQN